VKSAFFNRSMLMLCISAVFVGVCLSVRLSLSNDPTLCQTLYDFLGGIIYVTLGTDTLRGSFEVAWRVRVAQTSSV